jgi:predicted PurR-regulated permease PerM
MNEDHIIENKINTIVAEPVSNVNNNKKRLILLLSIMGLLVAAAVLIITKVVNKNSVNSENVTSSSQTRNDVDTESIESLQKKIDETRQSNSPDKNIVIERYERMIESLSKGRTH